MKAVATFHQPTSVVASQKTFLTDDEDLEFLVVAKTSVLEVFAILPDTLRLQCRLEVWGRVISLQSIPTEDTSKHNLLLMTDHPDPKVLLLEYTQSSIGSVPSLNTLKTVSLHERSARPAEFLNACLVDHRGKVAVASAYTGKLRVLELEDGLIKADFDTPVRELNIISLCFLRTTNARATVLGILYRDYLGNLKVTSHDLSMSDLELSPSASSFLPEFSIPDAEASLLIPVPPYANTTWNSNGGVLVLGGSRILFYSIDRKQKKKNAVATPKASGTRVSQAEVKWPYYDITAWSCVDVEGSRFLLGDNFGRLALLAIAIDPQNPGLDVLNLGEISPPTSLTPLPSQYVYVGSHFGDSQLVRITADKSSANDTHVDIVESYENIAPILDAVVEDIDGSGQPTIVTCSGGGNSGSLRIIRNGANFTEDARIDGITNIFGIWPLKMQFDDEHHQYLLVATDMRSHLLKLPAASHLSSSLTLSNDLPDLGLNAPTLAAANVLTRFTSSSGKSEYGNGSQIVQITRNAIVLLDSQTGTCQHRWPSEQGRKIVCGDISPSQICVALSGGTVVLLNTLGDKIVEQRSKTFLEPNGAPSEISALTIKPMKDGERYSSLVILGFWSSNEVRTYRLPNFEATEAMPGAMPHLPRSLLLHDFNDQNDQGVASQPYLMVGLASGTVVSMPFNAKGKPGEKKFFALGGAPVSLSRCLVGGQSAVFACGARSAVFYRSGDSMHHSPVLVKNVLSTSSLSSVAFSSSMVFSTLQGLVVGRILDADKLHIRTVSMGLDAPARLAYNASAKLFGVGCLKQDRAFLKGLAAATSSFKLVDDSDFKTRHEFFLDANEEISSISTVSLEYRGELGTFFAVGSSYFDPNEREPSRGRILIFSTGTSDKQYPHQVAAIETKGAVNALGSIKGKLVTAINTSVDIFNLVSGTETRLEKVTDWNHNYLVITVVTAGDQIVVGDAVSSLAVLKLEDKKLVTVARDYSPLWPLCVGVFDEQTIIGANNDNNLFSYKLQRQGNKMLFEQNGLFNIDETVTKCVPGCLAPAAAKFDLEAKQLLFTAAGRIAVVVDVNGELSRLLSSLERNLEGVIKGPGDVDHTLWRAPSNSRGRSDAHAAATGFLDGDLLERFLDYPASSPEVVRILSGKNEAEKIDTPYEGLRDILESLRSQH